MTKCYFRMSFVAVFVAASMASPGAGQAQEQPASRPQELHPPAAQVQEPGPRSPEPDAAARPRPDTRGATEPLPPGGRPVTPTEGAAVGPAKGPVGAVVKELRRGPLLVHGNYCGIGNRPGKPPIDALDEACMRHDACTKTGQLPSCSCDDRLRVEATAVAEDPRTPADVKAVAAATATSMALLVCKVTPRAPAPR